MTRDELIKRIRKNVPEDSQIVGYDIFYSSFYGLCMNDFSACDDFYKSSIEKLLKCRFCSKEEKEIKLLKSIKEGSSLDE